MTAPSTRPRRFRRPTGAALACLLAAALVPAGARADTRSDLDAARKRLEALQAQITRQSAEVRTLQTQIGQVAGRVDREEADLVAVKRRVLAARRRLTELEDELATLRARIQTRARSVYMRGSMTWLEFVITAQSLSDFAERVKYAAWVVRRDVDVALRVERVSAQVAAEKAEQERLAREQAAKTAEVKAERNRLYRIFATQQDRLAELAKARAEALSIVERLRDQLAAEELARIRRVAGKGMTITFGEWAGHFLRALGAPASRANLVVVVAWETAEYTEATWNPLATTMSMPGATTYNSHGVKNYSSMEQGIEATIKTLRRPGHGYERIVAGLLSSADSMSTGEAIRDSDWCRGCAGGRYVVSLIPAVEQYYDKYAGR